MKNIILVIIIINLFSSLLSFDKYAGEIYEIPVGVRNIALGNLGLTDTDGYSLAYWNSALIPEMDNSTLELMHAREFEGLFKYDSFSFYYHAQNSVAVSLVRIAINDIPLTELEDNTLPISNDNRPYVYKYVNNNDYLLNIALGRQVNDKLNIGITPKITYRKLAEEQAWAMGADLGFLYKVNHKFLLASKISNIVGTHILWEDGEYEKASPKIDLEGKYSFYLWKKNIPMQIFVRSEFYLFADNELGEYDLAFTSVSNHYGVSLSPVENISILAGYDIDSITAGIDLEYKGLSLFYAFKNNNNGDLGNSQKISIGYKF